MIETTSTNKTQTPENPDGVQVGQSSASLVGFWGKTPVDQPAALTAQLTTITPADDIGTADYSIQAVINSSAYGFASAAELITFIHVVRNLQVRVAELEARLEECGIVAAS